MKLFESENSISLSQKYHPIKNKRELLYYITVKFHNQFHFTKVSPRGLRNCKYCRMCFEEVDEDKVELILPIICS